MSDADPATDWFGHPVDGAGRRPAGPVPCPLCGASFREAGAFRAHTVEAHPHATPTVRRRPRGRTVARLQRMGAGLRFLPLWFVLPLNVMLTALVVSTFSTDVLWNPVAAMALRFSLLPSILLLAGRVAGTKP